MVIKDRLLDESDGWNLMVCNTPRCGHIAYYDWKRRTTICPVCGDRSHVHTVQTSYAFKLLLDEMKSLGVAMRLELRIEDEYERCCQDLKKESTPLDSH